jgi:hypothetical protein
MRRSAPFWKVLVAYTVGFLVIEALTMAFPEPMQALTQALGLPAFLGLIAIIAYLTWKSVRQPPQRR